MLARVALHQVHLSTPGLSLDRQGVALGHYGLLWFSSAQKLAAFLAVYSEHHSLEPLLPSWTLHELHSALGAQELGLRVEAESSDRLDTLAEAARLVGAALFTGSGRHYVQYRDVHAPLGYDAHELLQDDGDYLLHHQHFRQSYRLGPRRSLRELLLQMPLEPAPPQPLSGAVWLLAEPGVGAALASYLARTGQEARLSQLEAPRRSAFDDEPHTHHLLELPTLPPRLHTLVRHTPGVTVLRPLLDGVAIEHGYRHRVQLASVPVFPPDGLLLLRRHHPPLRLLRRPLGAPVQALQALSFEAAAAGEGVEHTPEPLRPLPLRLARASTSAQPLAGWFVPRDQLEPLRRLCYLLPFDAVDSMQIASYRHGAYLRGAHLPALPLGTPFYALGDRVLLRDGQALQPELPLDRLAGALRVPDAHSAWLEAGQPTACLPDAHFVPLTTLLTAPQLVPCGDPPELFEALPALDFELQTQGLGLLPLHDVDGQ